MEFTFDINKAMKLSKEKSLMLLDVSGAMVSSKAKQNIQAQFEYTSGNMEKQTFYYVDKEEFKAVIVTNTPYARIQEKGGDIKPKNAKALAVPIHPEAKKTAIPEGRSIRDVFPDLVMIKSEKTGHPLLIRPKGKDKFDVMYVLVSSVSIKANPYLVPALHETMPKVLSKVKIN